MKDIIKEVLRAIPQGAVVWTEPQNNLPDEDMKHVDLAAVDYEDFSQGRPGRTWWIGNRFLRIWFRKVLLTFFKLVHFTFYKPKRLNNH